LQVCHSTINHSKFHSFLTYTQDANIGFFKTFQCCYAEPNQDIPLAVSDEAYSTKPGEQQSFLNLVRLGNSKHYRPHVGLDGCDGFTAAAKYLLSWDIPLKVELVDHSGSKTQPPVSNAPATVTEKAVPTQAMDEANWPALGQAPKGELHIMVLLWLHFHFLT
jgi:hypothetical protein